MNSPPEIARAQCHHGSKGAPHSIKGGRPRLELTDEERAERRRQQQEAWRPRNGIPPKKTRTSKSGTTNWVQAYFDIWGKPPGVPLTPEEFAEREPFWNARVLAKIEEAEGYEARKLARRELRRASRERTLPPPVARPPAPPGSVPAYPLLARGGGRGPELALSLWKRPQVQRCCGA